MRLLWTYTEDLNDDAGVGSFEMFLKPKKDLTAKVELKGKYELLNAFIVDYLETSQIPKVSANSP